MELIYYNELNFFFEKNVLKIKFNLGEVYESSRNSYLRDKKYAHSTYGINKYTNCILKIQFYLSIILFFFRFIYFENNGGSKEEKFSSIVSFRNFVIRNLQLDRSGWPNLFSTIATTGWLDNHHRRPENRLWHN